MLNSKWKLHPPGLSGDLFQIPRSTSISGLPQDELVPPDLEIQLFQVSPFIYLVFDGPPSSTRQLVGGFKVIRTTTYGVKGGRRLIRRMHLIQVTVLTQIAVEYC